VNPDRPPISRQEIEAGQLEQLKSLLAELIPGNKFYSRKLSAVGVTFDAASLADFSKRVPFTTKPELVHDQATYPPFGSNLTYPLNRYTRFHQTSGTSGVPLRWLDTPESWDWMVESWMQIFRAAKVGAGDRVYFAFSFGPFIGFWLAFESAARLGALCVPGGGLRSVARIRAILENGITTLCCTPTYALRLAEAATDENIDLRASPVRRIIVAGEPGGSIPAVRAQIEAAWPGARVYDHHGMTEVGPVTYECPARAGVLHPMELAYHVEIVDPASTRAAGRGEVGELVLTTLGRLGSPLLRYRTGDLVKASASGGLPCSCGSFELSLEGGILGRVDDMIVIKGVNVFPSAIEELVRGFQEISEYRVIVRESRGLPELTMDIETRSGCSDPSGVAKRLQLCFETALSLRVPVTPVADGSLPRSEMKSNRWTREKSQQPNS
jgi:phenylacetate-CoA ligase